MADRVSAVVLDRDGLVVGLLDQLTTFDATIRWQDLGALSVKGRSTTPGASEIVRGTSMAILVDGAVFASGPCASIIVTSDKAGDIVEASGPDDLAWINWRIGYPAAPSIDPNAAASSDISGPAEDVIYGYVNLNVGSASAAVGRQRVRVAHSGMRGSTVNESVRFTNLLEVAKRVAIVDGFGFRCRWDPANQGLPLFEVLESRDLIGAVQFSVGRGTISHSVATDLAPTATDVVVGGAGDGTARVFAQVGNPTAAAEWFRVEQFVDAGGVSDAPTLIQRAEDVMQQGGRTITLDAIETEGMVYGRDWQLGDFVTGVAGNFADVFVIVEVKLSGPPLRFTPTLAQFAGYRLGELATVQQRIIAQRLRSIETN